MKHLITLAAVACAFALNAAYMQTLKPGYNTVDAFGEIVALEANTISGSQVVSAEVYTVVNEYTNRTQSVTTPHVCYSFTITNYDGSASISTNVFDTFRYKDWMRGPTNLIISAVKQFNTNLTESVVIGKALKASYPHTVLIGTGTASNHYLKLTPASTVNFMGGFINVGCGENDNVRILIK